MAKTYRILVIDDNEDIHRDIERILNVRTAPSQNKPGSSASAFLGEDNVVHAFTEYEIESCYNGKDGLAKLESAIKKKNLSRWLLWTFECPLSGMESRQLFIYGKRTPI